MDYKEPQKRVTKNDKKAQRVVYSQKHIRNKLKILEKARNENIFYERTSENRNGVCKDVK